MPAAKKKIERHPQQIAVVGANDTGKSTFARTFVNDELEKENGHVLIVVPDDAEWPQADWVHPRFPHRIANYVGTRKIVYFEGLMQIIDAHFRNGLLLFDDCRAYFTKPHIINEQMRQLLIRRSQRGVDIMIATHGFTEIPPVFFSYIDFFTLFRTKENIDRRKGVMNNFDVYKAAQVRINGRANDTTKAWTKSGKIKDNAHYNEIIQV